MKILFIFFLLGIIFFIGCDKDTNPINDDNNNFNSIMPLKVGNSWTFIDSAFTDIGNFVRADTTKLKIIDKTNISYQGKIIEAYYWNWIDMSNGQPFEISSLCANDNDGFHFYGGRYLDSNIVLGKFLFLKFPTAVGEIWTNLELSFRSDSLFYIADTNIVTCISLNEKLEAGQDTIDCYVFTFQKSYSNEIDDHYLYFAKNIGYIGYIIKVNGIIRYKKSLISRQLLKYHCNDNRLNSSSENAYSILGIK